MDLQDLILVLYFSLAGSCLGILSGITPGIHVNTLSLILVAAYSSIEALLLGLVDVLGADPRLIPVFVSSMIVSAAVVHSFVDFIPSVFLGAPGESEVLSVLPGHRLLLAGKGMEAVGCAATGSLTGALLSLMTALPFLYLMGPPVRLYETISPFIPHLLIAVVLILILSERGDRKMIAVIDARGGSVERPGGTISVVVPAPVNEEPVRISGVVKPVFPRGGILETQFGSWKLLADGSLLPGFVTVSGVWRVRRRHLVGRTRAAALLLSSGLLGFIVLNGRLPGDPILPGFQENLLFPLLTGLFGVPTLLLSLGPRRLPPQEDRAEAQVGFKEAAKGAIIGSFVGWLPGVTSTAGSVIGTMAGRKGDRDPHSSARSFITMVSAVGTSSAVFSLVALAAIGRGRSGAMLAVREVLGSEGLVSGTSQPSAAFALLLLAVFVASLFGYFATLFLGRSIGRRLAGADLRRMTSVVLAGLVLLVLLFTGIGGALVLVSSTLLGLIPPLIGVSRVHLTGCLLVPIIVFFMGLEPLALGFLGS